MFEYTVLLYTGTVTGYMNVFKKRKYKPSDFDFDADFAMK